MLQIVLEEPGRFAAAEGPEPTPVAGEALVRVHRIGVCGTDHHAFAGRQPFFSYPRILGHELGVEVIDPGLNPLGLRAGDRCSVEPYLNCGRCIACRRAKTNCCADLKVMGVHVDGGMRPLLAVPSHKLHRSAVLSYEQLALVEMLSIGAHAIERAAILPDDFVLLIGAGPIGLSVLQFAALTGATLAVMDVREERLAYCREQFGVEHTLVPADAASRLRRIGAGELPAVVIDATGNAASMATTFDLVAPGGRIIFVGLVQGSVTFDDPNFHRREITLCSSRNALPETFRGVLSLLEAGELDTQPWITHRLHLADIPGAWSSSIAGNDGVLKAMIEV
jgi:2-desacetyl-2-hydroxyethyl bacteriochlorophyllide A dehydrogenase